MTLNTEDFTERRGPDYRPGNPVVFVFPGADADEARMISLANALPEAILIAPRGDAPAQSLRAHVARLSPARVIGIGYSTGADLLVAAMLEDPALFSHAVLSHPTVAPDIVTGDPLAGVAMLVTAGGQDPNAPPDRTGQLIEGLEDRGAAVKSVWHPGGHEIAGNEIEAIGDFLTAIRAGLVDAKELPIEREQDDEGKGRYLVRAPGDTVAEMTYRQTGADQLIIDHTEVPDAFRGTGTGMRLLKRLMADARTEGRKIIPICPFAAAQFERHPEWSDMLAYAVRTKGG